MQTERKPAICLSTAGAQPRSALWVAALGVIGCCVMTGLAAQVRIPIPGTDVPITLQSTAVLLTGFLLSPRRAVAAMLLYVLAGTAGLPFFAPGSAGLLGPTGGYIIGFLPAAWLVGMVRGGREASYVRLLSAGALGTAVIFAVGVMWPWRLALYGGNLPTAVMTGVRPFAAKAVVQLLLVVTAVKSYRGLRRGRTSTGVL